MQACRQTNIQTHMHACSQTNIQTDRQTCMHADKLVYRQTNMHACGQTDIQTDRQTCMLADKLIHRYIRRYSWQRRFSGKKYGAKWKADSPGFNKRDEKKNRRKSVLWSAVPPSPLVFSILNLILDW